MKDVKYYKLLMEALDEAVKNSINNVADIGRLNDLLIETAKRQKTAANDNK